MFTSKILTVDLLVKVKQCCQLHGYRVRWWFGQCMSLLLETIRHDCRRSLTLGQRSLRRWDPGSEVKAQSQPSPDQSNPILTTTPNCLTSTSTQQANDVINQRKVCACGFVAKNQRGLNIHARTHGDASTNSSSHTVDPTQFQFNSLNEADLIRKFGELMYKCKCRIPLVRIIQKSVRTTVRQELTKVIEYTATKNDTFAWLRLLSFPHIVLNTLSRNCLKDSLRPNIIRDNLETFSKLNDISLTSCSDCYRSTYQSSREVLLKSYWSKLPKER